jgi:hypothetical protein
MASSYPPGCSGTPYDEPEIVDLMPVMRNYGKGDRVLLCGKDADLDPGGQLSVINAWLNEDTGKLAATLYVYANICEPCQHDDETVEAYEQRQELAGEVVCTWNDYPGEWTGSDYWTFWLEPSPYQVECDGVPTKSQEEGLEMTPEELNKQAGILVKAIFDCQEIKAFRQNMAELSKAIDEV